jgi:polysaccharide biosynthesis/export protein
MQRNSLCDLTGLRLATVALLWMFISLGCAGRPYRAANLPPELTAPPPLNLDKINLSGLANNSVSVEVIQPGDVLDVSIVTDYTKLSTTTTPVRVADDGTVIVPLVGKVAVGGLEVEQAEQAINSGSISRGIFRNPCVTVTMKQCRTRKVTVVGAVNKPGAHELPRGSSSLMSALIAAEGLSKEASPEVEIRHTDSRQVVGAVKPLPAVADGKPAEVTQVSYQQTVPGVPMPSVVKVDLTAATAGAVQVPELRDGDVVYVAKRTLPPVYVIGLVRKPGEYAFPTNQELRVLDALALAGGASNPVAEEVMVIRKVPNAREPVRIAVSIQNAKNGRDNLALAPGDTVSVEQTAATMVVDLIQTFFRVSLGGSVSWF